MNEGLIKRLIGGVCKSLIPLVVAGCVANFPYTKTSYELIGRFVLDPGADVEIADMTDFYGTEPVESVRVGSAYFRYLGENEFSLDPNLKIIDDEKMFVLNEGEELISDEFRIVVDDINNVDWNKSAEVSIYEILKGNQ